MGNFRYANYDTLGNQIDDPGSPGNQVVRGSVDRFGNLRALDVDGSLVRISRAYQDLTIGLAIGNSIPGYSKFSANQYNWDGEMNIANLFAPCWRWPRNITPTTRTDANGIYSYSGQTTAAILADLETQFITPVRNASINPGLIIIPDCVVNDIATDVATATIKLNLLAIVRMLRFYFRGVIIIMGTPRPSFSNSSSTRVTAYQDMVKYVRTLENGIDFFVYDCTLYEDPANPGKPLTGYTDASVHANNRGAMVQARELAKAVNRALGLVRNPYPSYSNNAVLVGSGAAGGTNVSGTVPTNCTVTGSANGTFVSTAQAPGWKLNIRNNAAGFNTDLSTINTGNFALTGTEWSAHAQIRILSGAENLRFINLEPRLTDGGGATFRYYLKDRSLDLDTIEWRNGDVLNFQAPPVIANSGSFSAAQLYIRTIMKDGTTSAVEWELLNNGISVLS